MCQLYSQRKIDSDPSSLNYLLSVDSFLSGSSQFQNDKNMQLRLEGEKNNYAKFILESAPTIQAELVSAL